MKKPTKDINDWRLQAYSELAEDWVSPWTGEVFGKGSPVVLTAPIKLRKDKHLNIPIPNASASCLNISKKCWDEAKDLRLSANIDSSLKKQLCFPTDEEAINYIELIMQSIVFSFTAIESFVNELIPDSHQYIKQTKNGPKPYTKSEIERYLSIDEKIGEVLPTALNMASPKGKHKSWNELQKLKNIRDRLIHMKSEDRRHTNPDQKTLWGELVKAEPPYREAFSVIQYFIEKANLSFRWYNLGKSFFSK